MSDSLIERLCKGFGGACLPFEPVTVPTPNVRTLIYVIQHGDDGPVKIGFAAFSPEERMASLQCGNPVELNLRFTFRGDVKLERATHYHLRDIHVRGEWFKPVPNFLTRLADAVRRAMREMDGPFRVSGGPWTMRHQVPKAEPKCKGNPNTTDLTVKLWCADDESRKSDDPPWCYGRWSGRRRRIDACTLSTPEAPR